MTGKMKVSKMMNMIKIKEKRRRTEFKLIILYISDNHILFSILNKQNVFGNSRAERRDAAAAYMAVLASTPAADTMASLG